MILDKYVTSTAWLNYGQEMAKSKVVAPKILPRAELIRELKTKQDRLECYVGACCVLVVFGPIFSLGGGGEGVAWRSGDGEGWHWERLKRANANHRFIARSNNLEGLDCWRDGRWVAWRSGDGEGGRVGKGLFGGQKRMTILA